jgi:hypothetical protein
VSATKACIPGATKSALASLVDASPFTTITGSVGQEYDNPDVDALHAVG